MKRTLVQNPSARAITDRRAALAPILVLTVSLGVWGVGCSAWPGGTRSASTAGVSVGQTNAGGLLGSYLDHQAQELAVIPNAEVEQQDDRLLVTFAGDFLFETGSADLSPGAKNQLGQVAEALKRYPETDVVVKGYTDSAGSESFNLQLSEDRAGSVRADLIAMGVASHRITAVGFGEQFPVTPNETEAGRQQNRRVELELVPRQDQLVEGTGRY